MSSENSGVLLIYCDFDDTLFPTSIITEIAAKQNKSKDPTSITINQTLKGHLFLLENRVMQLIDFMGTKGEFYILTAANKVWIEECCKKFYPRLYYHYWKLLEVISARDENLFNPLKSDDPKEWKYFSIVKRLNVNRQTFILSIGDSMYEADASSEIRGEIHSDKIKYKSPIDVFAVKLEESSCINSLIHQINYLINNFDMIVIKSGESGEIQTLKVHKDVLESCKGIYY